MSDGFYNFLDRQTNNGKVFNLDLSGTVVPKKALTPQESQDRKKWNATLPTIKSHYKHQEMQFPSVNSTEVLLKQRLIAPSMDPKNITSRTGPNEARKGRQYPPSSAICYWENFDNEVLQHVPSPVRVLDPQDFAPFHQFVSHAMDHSVTSEATELAYLMSALGMTLIRSKLVNSIFQGGHVQFGRLDFVLLKQHETDQAAVVGECKSTHNLLLPSDGMVLVESYKTAFNEVVTNKRERTLVWSHVCHPLAQLFGYMVDNKCRYGVLTSATRTYFVYISGSESSCNVHLSNAYFIGQANYLRAWAYIYSKGDNSEDTEFKAPKWLTTSSGNPTPKPSPDGKDNEDGGGKKQKTTESTDAGGGTGNTSHHGTTGSHTLACGLADVPFEDLKVLGSLGYGRNGAVFKALWDGKEIALKQFDVGRDGDKWFDNELAAYMRLKDVWGVMVPRPLFMSETPSGGVKLLGLQMGRPPEMSDKNIATELDAVLGSLRRCYGVRHNDMDGRNVVYITDEGGNEKLAVIDWEDWEDLQ